MVFPLSPFMNQTLEDIIRQLKQNSSARMAGAVKTFPLRELLKSNERIQEALLHGKTNTSYSKQDLQFSHDKLQEIITKRVEAAQKLISKFANLSPEVISLNNSVFSLVPSRDVLEDVKIAYGHTEGLSEELRKASANILEAVNIEIQQRFYGMSPESIAVNYSGKILESYRKLLKNLLAHIEVDSAIFKVYSTITRNVIEGNKIYKNQISVAREFCHHVFKGVPPEFDTVFHAYTLNELERYRTDIQYTLNILQQDITRRPSIVEFSKQCQHILNALPEHFITRKLQMRKTTRVLQLSHYISFLTKETVSENATASLMLCQVLFEEIRKFLILQKRHLDVSLNIESIEDAEQKVMEGIRYRQFAIAQLFQEITNFSSEDLTFVSEKWLGDSNLLLQEIQHLVEDYVRRIPNSPQPYILELSEGLRSNIHKLHEAIIITKTSPTSASYPSLEFDRGLPNLSKFYDRELVGLIRKALKTGNTSSLSDDDNLENLETSFVIPLDLLHNYIKSFVKIIKTKRSI